MHEVQTKNADLELALQKLVQERNALQEQGNTEKSAMQNRIDMFQAQLDELVLSKNKVLFVY